MQRLGKGIAVILSVAIMVTQIGCSMVAPSRQRLSVNASEPDAKIYVNGQYIGTGNIQTNVQRNQGASVMVKKDGFHPAMREVSTEMSMTGVLDIIGGCIFLFPFIGLAFPGARSLDQNNVSVLLEKENEAPKP